MNFMNIPAIRNQQQALIKRNFNELLTHEQALNRAGGDSAMAPSDPSKQDYRVAAQAKTVKRQAINLQNKQKRIDYYA